MTADPLRFFATPPHACSYLHDRDAITVYVDPAFSKSPAVYTTLSRHGFRRSGEQIYVPKCSNCSACVPVRVPVNEFRPRRSHRRTVARNQDITVTGSRAHFADEHYDLYERYVSARHPGGGMDNPTPDDYQQFLTSSWCETEFFEFRANGKLVAVAVTDRLHDSFSAVYTFFEPSLASRSLGSFAILWQIDAARQAGLEWLYLGYWVAGSSKMSYKIDYQPQEQFIDGQWSRRRHTNEPV
ncbi:MAG: arginyltransferase [Pseudomonadota bacterium]